MEFDPEILSILEKVKQGDADASFDYAWEEGIKLYRKGRYFELHEVFEFQWKKEAGGRKLLLHGWIQLAISLNKVFVKPNIRGSKMQAEKSKEKFLKLSETGELSSLGREQNALIISYLEKFLSNFQSEESWDLKRITELSLPEMSENAKELFSSSVFPAS
ncbi:DUF309 domain-containing protein [Leptospira licerasiae]|uniref:PF03745 domain protein n=1 Tax=Leptospira licerasiae str. MMD4847 TaxID=1049971 RepID=A0ABN0HB36_9LEPT|nr:DUF309 domain-containing protein [Leptospira licerasiae]EIE01809.1 PF03745 domain protein [Leptospira licerasiae serovar Varillal str. VAR 010]EJZ42835.1 PF03745 domain protein [Leptospira licerasiae str. MMD4847]